MATKKKRVSTFSWSKVDPVVARSMLRAAYLDDKNQQQAARVTHLSTRAARFNADAQFGSPPKAARLSDGVYRALLRTWLPKANATTVDALTTAVRAGLSGAALKEPVDNKAQQLKFLQNRKLTTNLKANLRRTFRSSHLDTKTIPINELSPSKPSKPLDLDGKGASPPFALYPHQIEARAHLEALWNESSAFRGRLVLPTGAGKTDTVAGWALNHLALDPSLRVFWLVHQQELADQAMARFVAIAAQQRIGFHRRGRVIHSAGSALSTLAEDSLDVACLTYQSFTQLDTKKRKLLGRFLTRPTIIVVDEAHHAGAPSYDALLNLAEDTSDVRAIIGLTATPYPSAPSARFRFNTRFPQLVHSVDAGTLIRQGILARPLVTAVDTGLALDLTDAQVTVSTQTDIPSEVLRQLDDKNRNDLIVRTWKADPRRWGKTLVFAPTISHADSLARRFSRAGATTRSLHSYSADRIGTLEWFRNTSGPTVLVSVGMLTEGVDLPDAKTAFLARPTTSPILMRQMVGRVLRGPKAGGGAEAEVVYFRDTWRNLPDVLLPGEVLPDSRPAPGGRDAPSWSLGAIVDDDDLELRSDLAALIAHAFDALAPLFDLDDSDPFNDSPPAPLVNGSRLVGFYDIDEMPVPVFAHQVTGVESLLRDALEFDLKGTAFLSYFDDTPPPYPSSRALKALVALTRELNELPQREPVTATIGAKTIARRLWDAGPLSENDRAELLRQSFDRSLNRVAFSSLEAFEEAVNQELRQLRRGVARLDAESAICPDAIPGNLPTLPRFARDLAVPTRRAVEQAKLILPPAHAKRLSALPTVRWTSRCVSSTWGHWSLKLAGKGKGKAVVRVNRVLRTRPKHIPHEMLAYLIYHELLHHLLPGQNHDAEFRELEARWPGAEEFDMRFDTLHELWDLRPDSYPNDKETCSRST